MRKLLLLLLLACPVWCWGTISLINCQSNVASLSASVSITSFVLTTAGDGIMVWTGGSTITVTPTVSDNGSGGSQTYTQAGFENASAVGSGYAFTVANATSAVNGATITASWSGSLSLFITACEVTNAVTSGIVDGTPAGSTANLVTSLTSGALTTSNAGTDLLVYCIGASSTSISSQTAGTNYAIPSGATSVHDACQTRAVTGTQSGVTTSMSWTTSATHVVGLYFALEQSGSAVNSQFDKRRKLARISIF
jgi:hypothetical protein